MITIVIDYERNNQQARNYKIENPSIYKQCIIRTFGNRLGMLHVKKKGIFCEQRMFS